MPSNLNVGDEAAFSAPRAQANPSLARSFSLTRTERNYLVSLAMVLAIIGVAWWYLGLERSWGLKSAPLRLVFRANETPARLLGLSHFIMGLIFMLSSRAMARRGAWSTTGGLALLAGVLCAVFFQLGGGATTVSALLLAGYFIWHDLRDQIFFFRTNKDAPPDEDRRAVTRNLLLALVGLVLFLDGLYCAMIASGAVAARGGLSFLGGLAAPWQWMVVAAHIAASAAAISLLKRRLAGARQAGIGAFVAGYRPILLVLAGNTILTAVEFHATGHAHVIVLMHVVTWYVFARSQYLERNLAGAAMPGGLWSWMRSTPRGFTALHAGLAVAIIAVAAVWAYQFQSSPSHGVLRALLGRESFAYWTIVHVTLSWLPK